MASSNATAEASPKQLIEQAILNCTLPRELFETKPLFGDWHAHDFMLLIGGCCLVITFVTSLSTAIWHLRHYNVPREQRQVSRIVWTPFVYGHFYFLSLWFYPVQTYLVAAADLYEIFALVAIYLLFLAYVCPDHEDYESHFVTYERARRKRDKNKSDKDKSDKGKKRTAGSLLWFQIYSFSVLQILPAQTATTVATWITQATMCPLTKQLTQASLIIRVINGVLLALLVGSVVQIYRGIKPELKAKNRKGGTKLAIFKVMVILAQVQPIIFTALAQAGVLQPSIHFSILDYVLGLPYFITVIEMTIFSIAFVFLFGAADYRRPTGVAQTELATENLEGRMGFWTAFLHVINYSDVIKRAWVVLSFSGYRREKEQARLLADN